jgi:hypothetical protein
MQVAWLGAPPEATIPGSSARFTIFSRVQQRSRVGGF